MNFSMDDAVPMLRCTPAVLRAWLWDLPEPWTASNEGPDTWSPYDVVGHLIHGERTDWIPRAELLLTHGDSRPFTPFDRFAAVRLDGDVEEEMQAMLAALANIGH